MLFFTCLALALAAACTAWELREGAASLASGHASNCVGEGVLSLVQGGKALSLQPEPASSWGKEMQGGLLSLAQGGEALSLGAELREGTVCLDSPLAGILWASEGLPLCSETVLRTAHGALSLVQGGEAPSLQPGLTSSLGSEMQSGLLSLVQGDKAFSLQPEPASSLGAEMQRAGLSLQGAKLLNGEPYSSTAWGNTAGAHSLVHARGEALPSIFGGSGLHSGVPDFFAQGGGVKSFKSPSDCCGGAVSLVHDDGTAVHCESVSQAFLPSNPPWFLGCVMEAGAGSIREGAQSATLAQVASGELAAPALQTLAQRGGPVLLEGGSSPPPPCCGGDCIGHPCSVPESMQSGTLPQGAELHYCICTLPGALTRHILWRRMPAARPLFLGAVAG